MSLRVELQLHAALAGAETKTPMKREQRARNRFAFIECPRAFRSPILINQLSRIYRYKCARPC